MYSINITVEKIITDNVEIFEILEQNDTESALMDRVIELVRVPEEQPPANDEANGSIV